MSLAGSEASIQEKRTEGEQLFIYDVGLQADRIYCIFFIVERVATSAVSRGGRMEDINIVHHS